MLIFHACCYSDLFVCLDEGHHYPILSFFLKFKANAEIPEDPEVALRQNAVKIIREDAVIQAKKMIALVESISATTIKNSVVGESFRTKSKGIKQIIQKYVVIFNHTG